MDNKYTIRMYHYISGEIQLIIKKFEKIEEAILEGARSGARHYKVYDCDGNLCHDSSGSCDTYA